ncbi:MAG: type I glyceraldehyde-3-phosphate dehydrogenase [Holosporales bacterium]|jgi:glyceraldehyde 3-phosphate dehydrogenase|nr:type I glyceraldehyde-3-phosphate dehydrogenase [Holosporales bacterium]
MIRIGINGFGRIGRMIVRAYFENISEYKNSIEMVCVNDISSKDTNIHLLKYDSIHGRAPFDITTTDLGIKIGTHNVFMINEPDPEKIDWKSHGIDVVFECSGRFTKKIDAEKHIRSGASVVIVSAPSEGADITVVYGINHKNISKSDKVISNASCTTNCIAPIAYLIDREFGIETGYMTTIHAYTGDQRLIDTTHNDLRRARAACLSMIPSSTGAAKAVGLILPHLNGKLDGTSIRVPTANVSLVDFKCIIKKSTTVEQINEIMNNAANGELNGILGYNNEPLVSTDFNHSKYSSVFDSNGTKILEGKFCRVMGWYDNEFGFSNRMLDVAKYINEIF